MKKKKMREREMKDCGKKEAGRKSVPKVEKDAVVVPSLVPEFKVTAQDR